MAHDIYKITVLGWDKHNANKKKGHTHFLFHAGFFQDPKISQLKPIEALLYVNLLCIAADMLTNSYEIHCKLLPKSLRIDNKSLMNCLNRLQSLQLLSVEKNESLYNRIEKNRKEDKGKEIPSTSESNPETEAQKAKDSENNRLIWESFSSAYEMRWKVKPLRNAAVNAQISNLRKKVGVDDAVKIVKFYLTHNDQFYLKNTHSFSLCLRDAETLRTQMLRGHAITSAQARNGEKQINLAMNVEEAKKGGF